MLLPDLIDKPRITRNLQRRYLHAHVRHTGLLIALVLVLYARRSSALLAVGLGMVTHVALDCLLDLLTSTSMSALVALTWPFFDTHFSTYDMSITDHLRRLVATPVLSTELIGLGLIAWEYRRSRQVRA
jgi:membrane-bound metal-dependent hydrolase YbcI (DUF457 family)